MRVARGVLAYLLLVGVCWSVLPHELVRYDGPAKRLRGRVTDYRGAPIPGVAVEVYDNPQVWSDESLSLVQKRTKQNMVASSVTDEKGTFNVRGVSRGLYEVQFSRMGWNTLSVMLNVDPHSRAEELCVELPISGGAGEFKVKSCR
jgi:protocatechuate 3,4-dioxygenase beta subunit